jgi:hypothetical protein
VRLGSWNNVPRDNIGYVVFGAFTFSAGLLSRRRKQHNSSENIVLGIVLSLLGLLAMIVTITA